MLAGADIIVTTYQTLVADFLFFSCSLSTLEESNIER